MNKNLTKPPLLEFLEKIHQSVSVYTSGSPADYIPELAIVNPDQFGIALTTVDGITHSVGDSSVEFTIQSISKAFVYSLAIEKLGSDEVLKKIGVEPSGEAFNSIRLNDENRPFNPMVNSGAIACTGLICEYAKEDAFDVVIDFLSEFAGRKLSMCKNVFNSENLTGDRNRAIAWLLKNNKQFDYDVEKVLDLYFKQCSILVTAKDLSIMAATMSKNGFNPITKKRVISNEAVIKSMSIMVSSGMYDYSGEWTYRIGLPAKSGVGGGITAVLPSEFGLGVFSPPLDELGNSVRGIKVCQELSSHFKIHLLHSEDNAENCIRKLYDLSKIRSLHNRKPIDEKTLNLNGHKSSVIELGGNINLVQSDSLTRAISKMIDKDFIVISLEKVSEFTSGAVEILKAFSSKIDDKPQIIFCGLRNQDLIISEFYEDLSESADPEILQFDNLDRAIEWVENQIISICGENAEKGKGLQQIMSQPILQNLSSTELDSVKQNLELLEIESGKQIIALGQEADGIFLLLSGKVEIALDDGKYLATVSSGTCFGELALISPKEYRQANIFSTTSCSCAWISAKNLNKIFSKFPGIKSKMLLNLSLILVDRLNKSNAKIALGT